MTIVPRSTYRSRMGTRNEPTGSRSVSDRLSNNCSRVASVVLLAPDSYIGRHQGQTSGDTSSLTLAPFRPEMGMKRTSFLMA